MNTVKNLCLSFLLIILFPCISLGADSFFVSPRAMGMGGANVVSVKDTSAQYYNPAAFALFNSKTKEGEQATSDYNNLSEKVWGVDLGLAGGYRLHGEFGRYVDDLADIDLDRLKEGVSSGSELQDLIKLVSGLSGIDQPDTGLTADLAAGSGIRVSHFGVGVRSYAQASSQVLSLDDQNLGFEVNIADLNTQISTVTQEGNDGAISLFTSDQQAQLQAAGLDTNAIQQLDFAARDYGVSASEVQDVVDLLDTVATSSDATSSGTTSLDDNTTTVALTGFAYGEVPISYGYAINEHIAIGGNLKFMRGRVYGNQILVFDNDSGDLINETDKLYQETSTFGLDLGLLAHYNQHAFGLVCRNLNAPKFDGFSEDVVLSNGTTVNVTAQDVRIDPQVTAGYAYMPYETLTIETNLDLTQNETTLPGYKTQNVSLGMEWDAFKILALRAGIYKNLAEDDIDLVYTLGIGLNLWAARLDIAGTMTGDSYEYDGSDVPQESRVAAALSIDF